ncbi:MAG TPA: hypothetical protein VGJ44_22240, partial [Kribbellaceae bacterium]
MGPTPSLETYTGGEKIKVWARVVGQYISVKVSKQLEPTMWLVNYLHSGTSGQASSGSPGLGMIAATGNTNATKRITFDQYAATDLSVIRRVGEVANWPTRWDKSHSDITAPVEVYGILRRLSQGQTPLKSALYRELTSILRPDPIAYWPCEDEEGATQVGAAVGAYPMKVTGTAEFAQYSDFDCSSPLPTMGTARFRGRVAPHTATGVEVMRMLMYQPAATGGDRQVMSFRTNGTGNLWVVWLTNGGDLYLKVYDDDDQVVYTSSTYVFAVNGKQIELKLQATQNGSNVDFALGVRYLADNSALVATNTVTSRTVGTIQYASVAYDQNLPDLVAGHVVVANTTAVFDGIGNPIIAWRGETAGRRIERLCNENAIRFHPVGDLDDTEPLGVQRPEELLTLLQEAADADLGILYETWFELGLSYRTRVSIYNQTATLALNYAANELSPPLEPDEDDSSVRNDVTVERVGGTTARAVKETGRLSVGSPPFGVGRYDDSVSLLLYDDDQVDPQAQWRMFLGTWDEARYPRVTVNLSTHPSLATAAATVREGDRITISNPPAWLPPDMIDLIVQGHEEENDGFARLITWNCTPGGPWRVGVLDDATLGRADTAGSTLATGAATGYFSSGTALSKDYIIISDTDATGFAVGNLVQLYTATGATKEATTFTVTAKNS